MINQLDIRFERIKQDLWCTLLELLNQTPSHKISVADIRLLACYSLNPFYQHYETKNHLYRSLVNEISETIKLSSRTVIS